MLWISLPCPTGTIRLGEPEVSRPHSNRPVNLIKESRDVGSGLAFGFYWLMKYYLDFSTAGEKPALGHQLECALDGYGNDWRLSGHRQEETAALKRLKPSAAAPGPLGKNQEGISPSLHHPGCLIDAALASAGPLAVNGDKAHEAHPGSHHGNPEDALFQDDPDPLRYNVKKKRPVQEAQVIGHEDVAPERVYVLSSLNFNLKA